MNFLELIGFSTISMSIVFIILYILSILMSSLKFLNFKKNTNLDSKDKNEEELVAVLISSIIASQNENNKNFRVKNIKRIA